MGLFHRQDWLADARFLLALFGIFELEAVLLCPVSERLPRSPQHACSGRHVEATSL